MTDTLNVLSRVSHLCRAAAVAVCAQTHFLSSLPSHQPAMPPSTIFTKLRRGAVVDGSDVKGIQALADLVGSTYTSVTNAKFTHGFFETGNGEGYFPKPRGGWTEEAVRESFVEAYPIDGQLVRRCSQTGRVKETYFSHKHASAACPALRTHTRSLPQHFKKSNFRDKPHLYAFVYSEESQHHGDILCHGPHGTGDGSAFRRLVNNALWLLPTK